MAKRLAGFGTTIFTEMTRLAVEHGAINLAQGRTPGGMRRGPIT